MPQINSVKDLLTLDNLNQPSEFGQLSTQRLDMASIDIDSMMQPSLNMFGKYQSCKNNNYQNKKLEDKMRDSFYTTANKYNNEFPVNLHQHCGGHAHVTKSKKGKKIKVVYFQPILVTKCSNDNQVSIFSQKY